MNLHSLRIKIILICAACIIVVGAASNTLLYLYLTSIISEKADSFDRLNLQSVQFRLNQTLYQFEMLGDLCSNDLDIARALSNRELTTLSEKQAGLRAHEAMRLYLSATNIEQYVLKLMVFNESGLMAQAASNVYSTLDDVGRVRALPLFDKMLQSGARRIIAISPSTVNGEECITLLGPVYDYALSVYTGWLYIEMDMGWLHEIIALYGNESFFITGGDGYPLETGAVLPEPFLAQPLADGLTIRDGSTVYRLRSAPLRLAGLTVFLSADVTYLSKEGGRPVLYTVAVVVITSLVAALLLAVLLSSIITIPLGRLMARIRKISGNDLGYDPDIERGNDEISLTGKLLNEMTGSIRNLLRVSEEMYERQKNAEIALLQSQVNPHFLYNTLDSIHWMATIQKNTGIATMTKSLSALLKNLTKGIDDKIPLGEELSLLQDYVNIQSLRYMGDFTFINRVPERLLSCLIIKLTLQPLVENAIFHGIEPKDAPGTITVNAMEDSGFLLITVRDDGVGMTPEELTFLTSDIADAPHRDRFSGMGVYNVHERLRLTYGNQCGLTYVSERGVYTEVTVRIPKDEGNNNV